MAWGQLQTISSGPRAARRQRFPCAESRPVPDSILISPSRFERRRSGAGEIVLGNIWPGHPEKLLAFGAAWARDNVEIAVPVTAAVLAAPWNAALWHAAAQRLNEPVPVASSLEQPA